MIKALLGRAGGALCCLNFKNVYHCANKYMKDACFWKGRVTTEENFVCLFVCLLWFVVILFYTISFYIALKKIIRPW